MILQLSRSPRALALVGAIPILAMTIAGCSLVPSPESIVERVVEEAANQTGEDIDLDVGLSGDGASLPEGWPDLPVPEGNVVSAIRVNDSFSISVEVADEDAARATVDELQGLGFEVTSETDFGQLKGVMLTSDEWSIVYGWTVSDDGIVVSYTVSSAAG